MGGFHRRRYVVGLDLNMLREEREREDGYGNENHECAKDSYKANVQILAASLIE